MLTIEEMRILVPVGNLNPVEMEDNHVKYYSATKLFWWGFINPRGSVLNIRLVLRTLLKCAIATFIAFFPCSASPGWEFCFPVVSSTNGLIFASLVSFLLGLFVSLTFSRWWSIREKLSCLMSSIKYCSMCISAYVAGDEHVLAFRDKMIRWLNLIHALVYKYHNRDLNLADLGELITKEEAEALASSPNMPGTVVSWLIIGWKELALKKALTPESAYGQLTSSFSTLLSLLQDISAFLETQIPYSYMHLLTLTTKIHLVFVVFYGASLISDGITSYSWPGIIFGYAVISTNSIIYEGLLAIHEVLVNPFGKDLGDFPTKLFRYQTESFTSYINKGPSIRISIE